MRPAIKLLLAFAGMMAFCILGIACMALAWPDVPLVRQLGCFDAHSFTETHVLVPIQSQPLAFAIGSGAVIVAALLTTAFSTWQERQAIQAAQRTPAATN